MYILRPIAKDPAGQPMPNTVIRIYLEDGTTPATIYGLDGQLLIPTLRTDPSGGLEFKVLNLVTLTFRETRSNGQLGTVKVLYQPAVEPEPVPPDNDILLEAVALEPITMGQAVLSGLNLADANTLAHMNRVIGLAANSGQIGDTVGVIGSGFYMTNTGWSFTPGEPVYLGLNGALTQNPAGLNLFYPLGVAVSSARIFINVGPAIRRT